MDWEFAHNLRIADLLVTGSNLDRVGWGQDVRSWADFQSVAVADPEDRDRGREGGLGCR